MKVRSFREIELDMLRTYIKQWNNDVLCKIGSIPFSKWCKGCIYNNGRDCSKVKIMRKLLK